MSENLEQVFVCDMGIAKMKQVAEATRTSLGKGPGTFPYMAPEMFKKGHRGTPVDIYLLGCPFIELFGRGCVWLDLDGPHIMLKVMGSYDTPPEMPDISHLNSDYQKICFELCQLQPDKRPNIAQVVGMINSLK